MVKVKRARGVRKAILQGKDPGKQYLILQTWIKVLKY